MYDELIPAFPPNNRLVYDDLIPEPRPTTPSSYLVLDKTDELAIAPAMPRIRTGVTLPEARDGGVWLPTDRAEALAAWVTWARRYPEGICQPRIDAISEMAEIDLAIARDQGSVDKALHRLDLLAAEESGIKWWHVGVAAVVSFTAGSLVTGSLFLAGRI